MFDLSMLPAEQRLNPYPLYKMMRQANPVLFLEPFDMWMAFGYDDVKTVLSDYTTYSSDFAKMGGLDNVREAVAPSLIGTDPPMHTKLRSLVTRAFTHKAVASLEPRIAALTHQMIDRVAESGQIDLIKDLAYPLPVVVIADMLGIPSDHHADFKLWSDQVVASADSIFSQPDRDLTMGGPPWMHGSMHDYFQKVIQQRRVEPREDLISGLLAAELDGQQLSEQDVLSFCGLLLIAGNVTTTNLIGNTLRCLLENPDQFVRLKAEPDLIQSAIEETLRYLAPVQAMFRVSVREGELSGQKIAAGKRVLAIIGSANRDETRFSAPDEYDIARSPNPHIGFGYGIHFCLGAPLARLEARTVLPIILERLKNLARANNESLQPVAGFIVNGVSSLPLVFTAPSSRPALPERLPRLSHPATTV